MRGPLLLLCTLATAGCGELTGAAPYSEFRGVDSGARDGATVDAGRASGVNDIDGYFVDDIVPQTRAIFRLDRASDPARPQIVFVSSADAVSIACETFRAADWGTRLPAGVMVHVLELGSAVPAKLSVKKDSPPAIDAAVVGRAFPTKEPLALDKALAGTVTITAADRAASRGSFEATFVLFYDDDPFPYEQTVTASFDAPACAVD
ncbi:MAG: hypothetical protein HYV09_32505 [Deltaproteobacteria bacterium]|nr:hypothetical protein [Deltaproteobacteria bacterium]